MSDSKQATPITSTTTTPTTTATAVATVVQDSREFLEPICDDQSWSRNAQQAASPAVVCSMEQRLVVPASTGANRQVPPSLSLTGFTCDGNSLRITNSDRREGTLTYQPPMLINLQGQEEPFPQEELFAPSSGRDTARAIFIRDGAGNKNFILQMGNI